MEDYNPQIPEFQSRINKKRTYHSEKNKQNKETILKSARGKKIRTAD